MVSYLFGSAWLKSIMRTTLVHARYRDATLRRVSHAGYWFAARRLYLVLP